MRLLLGVLTAIAFLLGGNVSYAEHPYRCDLTTMKDLSAARNEKGKKRKGYYIDDFTRELLFATEKRRINIPGPGKGEVPKSRVIHANVWGASKGDETIPEADHAKQLNVGIIYEKLKKTFPTSSELEPPFAIREGGGLQVGMSDGSVVTLSPGFSSPNKTEYATPEPYSGEPFRLKYESTFTFELDATTLAALISQGARAIRVQTSIGDLDVRLTRDDYDLLQYTGNCIAGETT